MYQNNRMRLWISRHVEVGGGPAVGPALTARIRCPIWSENAAGSVRRGWKVFLSVEEPGLASRQRTSFPKNSKKTQNFVFFENKIRAEYLLFKKYSNSVTN